MSSRWFSGADEAMTTRIPRPGWHEPEQAIVSRYVRAVAAGRYPDMLTATRECVAEIEGLHRRWRRSRPEESRAIRPRTFQTFYTILRKESQQLGRAPAVSSYLPEETKLMRDCAQAVAEGRFPNVREATRAIWPEFERIWAGAENKDGVERTLGGISQRICLLARSLKQPRPETGWFPAEDRVIDRFARRVLAGDYRSAHAAVPDCRAELARLANSSLRSPGAVHIRLNQRLRRLGRSRPPRFQWR